MKIKNCIRKNIYNKKQIQCKLSNIFDQQFFKVREGKSNWHAGIKGYSLSY